MKLVFITGIEGFVGTHLARRLSEDGYGVTGLHWTEPSGQIPADLHHGDICDFEQTKALLERTKPDAIVHLAGLTSVATSETHILTTHEVNTLGTLKLLEAVHQLKLGCRVLLITSADVYGRSNLGRPLTEDDLPLPVSPYALSKLFAGEAGRFYHRAFDMDVVILRPFSHTGPGQAPNFIFPKVAQAIARIEQGKRDPVIEMGNLEVRRDYTDVRDMVRAYSLALTRCKAGESYNVTSGKPVLLKESVDHLCSLAKTPVTIKSSAKQFRAHDIPILTGDSTKFQAATGWSPEIPFTQTLSDLLDYYRGQ